MYTVQQHISRWLSRHACDSPLFLPHSCFIRFFFFTVFYLYIYVYSTLRGGCYAIALLSPVEKKTKRKAKVLCLSSSIALRRCLLFVSFSYFSFSLLFPSPPTVSHSLSGFFFFVFLPFKEKRRACLTRHTHP